MKRIILTYGSITSALLGLFMTAMMFSFESIGFDNGMYVGYASMVLSFCIIYFAIGSFKKNNDGTVTFGQGMKIGLAITAIACLVYTIIWMILSVTTFQNFMADYTNHMMESLKKSGATAAELQAKARELAEGAEMYKNPVYRAAFTFMEPLPVGIIVSLISALIQRMRK